MRRNFANRLFAGLACVLVAIAYAPAGVKAQQATQSAPVTETAATQAPSGGGQLQKVTVTGYIIPRVGAGPQPVVTLDQDVFSKQADQTVGDVLERYTESLGSFNPITTAGNSFSPGTTSVGL